MSTIRDAEPAPSPIRASVLLAHCVLLAVGLLACGGGDPLEDALRRQAQGDFAGSIEPLRTVLEERPDDPEVNYLYGRALTATGQPSLAEWALRRAAQDPEWIVPAGSQLAVSALWVGNFNTAIDMSTQVLEVDPDNVDVLLTRAQAYGRSRLNSEKAIEEADRVLALDPTRTAAMEPKILALLHLERIEEAEASLEQLGQMIAEDPDSDEQIRGWHCSTNALFTFESDKPDEAEALWEDCLEQFPAHSDVVTNAIDFYDGRQEYATSHSILERAVAAAPRSIDLRRRLAWRTRHIESVEAAEQILVEGTELAEPPHLPSALQILAKHYQDTGAHDEAAATFSRAVDAAREVGEPPAQLLFDYADALILQGDFEAAAGVTEQMQLAPHREMILARIAQEQGDHETALAHYEEAFRLWPDNPWARYLAARSAEATGQFDRAIELYRYAIRIKADATDARYRLAKIHVAEGRPTEGLSMLKVGAPASALTLRGELLSLELSTWAGEQTAVATLLERLAKQGPEIFGHALVALGDGARMRFGPDAAAQVVERYRGGSLDVQNPARPTGLHKLIELRFEAGNLADLESTVRAAVAAHPDVSGSHAALGRWLELTGASPEEARASYSKALELATDDPYALAGMARLVRAEDPAEAIALFDRAAAADPEEPAYGIATATLLAEHDRTAEAIERLTALLEAHPHSTETAMTLAELKLAQGDSGDPTRQLAERAVRFQGGAEAMELLARVYRERDQPDRATEMEARARALRATKPAAVPPAA